MHFEENYKPHNLGLRSKLQRSTTALTGNFERTHKKNISSPNESPFKESIPTEVKPNSPIAHTINFNTLHRKYNNSFIEATPKDTDTTGNRSTGKKYLNNISRLNQEIQIMSTQLKLANETIAALTAKLHKSDHAHALHIQELHERHEQKITKIKNDIEKLASQTQNKQYSYNLQKIIMEKSIELEDQNKTFTEKLSSLTAYYEKQLKFKDKEHSKKINLLKKQFLQVVYELKEKFLGEIESLHMKYRTEMDQVKDAMKVIGSREGGSEDEISTAVEIDHEKNIKHQDNESDLQIIEELSSQQNIIFNPLEKSIGSSSDLDTSLRQLIGQISFDNEMSLTDILDH